MKGAGPRRGGAGGDGEGPAPRARARDAGVEEVREEAAEDRLAERAAGAGAPEVREEPALEAAAVADAGREGVLVEGPAQAERRRSRRPGRTATRGAAS